MSNDSITKTLLVAALLCIVCSILVSTAAVMRGTVGMVSTVLVSP